MKIDIVKKSKNAVEFVLEDSSPAFANTLRRYLAAGVPTMAIKEVIFADNTSGLFDEIIAHRLGMIPLTYDQKVYRTTEDCNCKGEGCDKCQVTLVLDKKGPCSVYTKDMKSTDPSVKPTSDDIIIDELLEGQTLKLEAVATLGYGSSHAKHQAAVVGYKYQPKVSMSGKGDSKSAMAVCPKNVFAEKDGKVYVANAEACDMCLKCSASEAINISSDETKLIFRMESICGMDALSILKNALERIAEDAKNVASEIKKKC